MTRRAYSGAAPRQTLNGGITSGVTAIIVTDATGWPAGPSSAVIDRGLSNEEKVLYASRSGNTLNSVTRGYDGTVAAAHSSGAYIEHSATAVDLDEANALVNLPDAAGDLAVASAADTWARLGIGADFTHLRARAAATNKVEWAALMGTAAVATQESLTTSAYTDLTTVGPAVTITTGTQALVVITATLLPVGGIEGYMSVAVSGATTIAAADTRALQGTAALHGASRVVPVTGLTAGSNIFTAKYRSSGGSGSGFKDRSITVIPF